MLVGRYIEPLKTAASRIFQDFYKKLNLRIILKKIYIFSLGYAGRAIFENFKDDKNYEILGFIENNAALVGSEYKGYKVFSAKEAASLDCDFFVMSGAWADDMSEQLLSLGVEKSKIFILPPGTLNYSSKQRERLTDEAVRRFDIFMRKNDKNYFMCNSGLLTLLRKKVLSCASDVDLYVTKYEDIYFLAKELTSEFSDFLINIKYYQKDSILHKAGDISRIAITNDARDKIVIDIGLYERYGDFYIAPYDSGEYFYMPKEYFDGYSRLDYKDFSISVLARYDEYLSYMYGKNYIEIPKKFTKRNYLNLGDKEKLDKLNALAGQI